MRGSLTLCPPYIEFQKLAKRYGPIFQVKLGSQTFVSVNDPRLAKELFEKRGSKYSGRPDPYVGYKLMSQSSRLVLTQNGNKHATLRRQLHNILSISRTATNSKIQELESRQLLNDFLEFSGTLTRNTKETTSPDYADVQSAFRRYTLSVMMTLAFGHRVHSLHDQVVKTVFAIMDDISTVTQPGQYLVDDFPILKRLPYFLRTWEHESKRKLKWQWAFLLDLLRRSEMQMNDGTPNTGLIRSLLEQRRDMSERKELKNSCTTNPLGIKL